MFNILSMILFFITIFFIGSSYSGTIDPFCRDVEYIHYYTNFDCVVRLEAIDKKGAILNSSAVIIGPRTILMAAHSIGNTDQIKIVLNDKAYKIIKVIKHKDFVQENYGYYDIAIGLSEIDLPLSKYPVLYQESNEVNQIASICGTGMTGNFKTGAIRSTKSPRAGTNRIDRTYGTSLVCSASEHGAKDCTNLEFLICNGDSGGGLFIDGKLAGINSCVVATDGNANSDYGDETYHTRISELQEWIKDNQ